jgi:2-polyprenyl-3-methyl-5-hydroxy-6-metoxy-1,4-benzoquinol methylase
MIYYLNNTLFIILTKLKNMSQRTNKFYNFINSPITYMLIQKIMSGTSFRKKIIKKNIINTKIKVLDIGCGPAEILKYIPTSIYYGYDVDKRSISYAKNYFSKPQHHFYCKKFTEKEIKRLPKFDYVILFGILHHLQNEEIKKILNLCKKAMKKNAILLTEDPIFVKNQNPIARFLINKDRGLCVRKKKEYINLIKKSFKRVNSKITHQFFIPYTWFTMICKK